jgi:hypothetical protein
MSTKNSSSHWQPSVILNKQFSFNAAQDISVSVKIRLRAEGPQFYSREGQVFSLSPSRPRQFCHLYSLLADNYRESFHRK